MKPKAADERASQISFCQKESSDKCAIHPGDECFWSVVRHVVHPICANLRLTLLPDLGVRQTPRLSAFRFPLSTFRFSSAFTLIELLVAATVSMLLVGLLLVATQGISTNYTRTQANITRQGDAAFALDQLIQDLEGYVVPNFASGEALSVTPETVGAATNAFRA